MIGVPKFSAVTSASSGTTPVHNSEPRSLSQYVCVQQKYPKLQSATRVSLERCSKSQKSHPHDGGTHFFCASLPWWRCCFQLLQPLYGNSSCYMTTAEQHTKTTIPNQDFHHHQKRTIWLCKCLRKIVFFFC